MPAAPPSVALGERARPAVESGEAELAERSFPAALWERDASAWPGVDPPDIRDWLGWVPVVDELRERAGELERWAADVRRELPATTLLGMGGSSLCAEVMRRTFGLPALNVLDTTHPAAVRRAERDDCTYIAASKSGGTIETRSHEAYFFRRSGENGRRFVAITDPGTSLAVSAREAGYRHVFENRTDIGGRYSALSYFGAVPGALAGVSLERLLERAAAMAAACRGTRSGNPGLALGGALGVLARGGRDKVTIVAEGDFESFGLWAEQLLAESTGKHGRGLVPVVGEPLGAPDAYGEDRVFVHLRADGRFDDALSALADAGHPVLTIDLGDGYDLGGEFFRWEVATAAAGSLLGIDPFDQPNVQESKDNTNALLERWDRDGELPAAESDPLDRVLGAAGRGAYVALMAYVDPGDGDESRYAAVRARIRDRLGVATTFGFGPRFLHSTGQLHKGGPQVGCFVQIVDPDAGDLAIPGRRFGFGTLLEAQALGDLQALRGRGRPVARVNVGDLEDAFDKTLNG